jgi:O-acetyl-ADP-ribose deacetylase (regulator of RNase III)
MVFSIKADITKTILQAVGHQVNCQRVMGRGVAKSMRDKWPQHYTDYMNDARSPEDKLSSFVMTETDRRLVFGFYGQLYYGADGRRYTDYNALYRAIDGAMKVLSSREIYHIAIPKFIGCGLGGGSWDIVQVDLENVSNANKVDIALYYI